MSQCKIQKREEEHKASGVKYTPRDHWRVRDLTSRKCLPTGTKSDARARTHTRAATHAHIRNTSVRILEGARDGYTCQFEHVKRFISFPVSGHARDNTDRYSAVAATGNRSLYIPYTYRDHHREQLIVPFRPTARPMIGLGGSRLLGGARFPRWRYFFDLPRRGSSSPATKPTRASLGGGGPLHCTYTYIRIYIHITISAATNDYRSTVSLGSDALARSVRPRS